MISGSGRSICWRRDRLPTAVFLGFPCGSGGKESSCNAGDLDSIPGLGRSPGEGKGYPLQYSDLENSMDCIVYGVTKILSDTPEQLSLVLFQTSQSFTISLHLLKLMPIESVMPSSHLILCHPHLLPSIFTHFLILGKLLNLCVSGLSKNILLLSRKHLGGGLAQSESLMSYDYCCSQAMVTETWGSKLWKKKTESE